MSADHSMDDDFVLDDLVDALNNDDIDDIDDIDEVVVDALTNDDIDELTNMPDLIWDDDFTIDEVIEETFDDYCFDETEDHD